MYKWIERAAWITGSLGLAGVILIFFLQGMDSIKPESEIAKPGRPVMKFRTSRPGVVRKGGQPAAVQPVSTQPAPPKPEPEIIKIEKEVPKPEDTKKLEPKPETVKPKEKPVVKPTPVEVEEKEPTETPGRMFAESELNQLVGKIQAAQIKFPALTNCVQIRITANNNNAQSVTQVERFLTDRGYIISGREKEDFKKGAGISVVEQGRCIRVTVGKK